METVRIGDSVMADYEGVMRKYTIGEIDVVGGHLKTDMKERGWDEVIYILIGLRGHVHMAYQSSMTRRLVIVN